MMPSRSLPAAVSSACSVIGDDPDSPAAEHGLEGDGVLALACEPGELPDKDLPERSLGFLGLVEHLLELGPVCDAAAFRLVHELAHDDVAVLVGVFPERPQLSGDGQVDVLPVAGDSGVQRHRHGDFVFVHQLLLRSRRFASAVRFLPDPAVVVGHD